MKSNDISLRKVLFYCYEGINGMNGATRMLFLYFMLQVILSGLASFVVPFFSSRLFAETSFSYQGIVCAVLWFVFAMGSVVIDFYGNKHNLKVYYRIQQRQLNYHMKRVLTRRYSELKRHDREEMVLRLNEDTEKCASIALWTVGIIAMLVSFGVVFVWSVTLFFSVFVIISVQSVISTELIRIIDKHVARLENNKTNKDQQMQEYHYVITHNPEILLDARFSSLIEKNRELLLHEIGKIVLKIKCLKTAGTIIENGLELASEILCMIILCNSHVFEAALIIPIFTLHSTYQNQLKTLHDYISSIQQNTFALWRLNNIECLSKYDEKNDCSNDVVLDIRGIYVEGDDGKNIINGLSLQIRQGEKVALVGPNGSGKTTLLRAILGLYESTRGVVNVIKSVAYMPVDTQMFDGCLVENCNFIKRLYGEDSIANFEKKEKLFPKSFKDIVQAENVNDLSGGQKQMASFFRAALYDRSLLIMDEPAKALEKSNLEFVKKYIKSSPNAILFVTHDPELAAIADRIVDLGCKENN